MQQRGCWGSPWLCCWVGCNGYCNGLYGTALAAFGGGGQGRETGAKELTTNNWSGPNGGGGSFCGGAMLQYSTGLPRCAVAWVNLAWGFESTCSRVCTLKGCLSRIPTGSSRQCQVRLPACCDKSLVRQPPPTAAAGGNSAAATANQSATQTYEAVVYRNCKPAKACCMCLLSLISPAADSLASPALPNDDLTNHTIWARQWQWTEQPHAVLLHPPPPALHPPHHRFSLVAHSQHSQPTGMVAGWPGAITQQPDTQTGRQDGDKEATSAEQGERKAAP